MLRLFVLLTVVVYCNSCSLDVPNDGTTNAPDCYDKEGNFHQINSDWSTDTETCVCSPHGTLCCPRDWEKWQAEHSGEQENTAYWEKWQAENSGEQENRVDWEKWQAEHSGEQENTDWEKWQAENSGEQENRVYWEKWQAEHSGEQENTAYDYRSNVGMTDFISDDFAAFT